MNEFIYEVKNGEILDIERESENMYIITIYGDDGMTAIGLTKDEMIDMAEAIMLKAMP